MTSPPDRFGQSATSPGTYASRACSAWTSFHGSSPRTRALPAVRAHAAEQDAQRRRLAGAVGSEEAVDLAALDPQVEAVEGPGRAEGLREPTYVDDSVGVAHTTVLLLVRPGDVIDRERCQEIQQGARARRETRATDLADASYRGVNPGARPTASPQEDSWLPPSAPASLRWTAPEPRARASLPDLGGHPAHRVVRRRPHRAGVMVSAAPPLAVLGWDQTWNDHHLDVDPESRWRPARVTLQGRDVWRVHDGDVETNLGVRGRLRSHPRPCPSPATGCSSAARTPTTRSSSTCCRVAAR